MWHIPKDRFPDILDILYVLLSLHILEVTEGGGGGVEDLRPPVSEDLEKPSLNRFNLDLLAILLTFSFITYLRLWTMT